MESIQKHIAQIGILALLLVTIGFLPDVSPSRAGRGSVTENSSAGVSIEDIAPRNGVELPVVWGDMGRKMIDAGVIDRDKFEALYQGRGGLTPAEKELLYGITNKKLVITKENSGIILNLLWALGLGNKNAVLENGPMQDKQYGGAGNFASTGGWTLAKGDPEGEQAPYGAGAMNHYSAHSFIVLTSEQQKLVERVAKNIYRPCCGNSTYFPDCNHGMAMLGLLELMASQGVGEENMYKAALAVNSYWFPDTYITIAVYMKSKSIGWNNVSPREVLGVNYSSASGYRRILEKVNPPSNKNSASCGQ